MSEDQLVDAYKAGRISRRVFVRGLLARGVPVAAAIAYATALAPTAAGWLPPALRTTAAAAATPSPPPHH